MIYLIRRKVSDFILSGFGKTIVRIPVFLWCHTCHCFKQAVEVGVIFKRKSICDILDGHIIEGEYKLRFLNLLVVNEL